MGSFKRMITAHKLKFLNLQLLCLLSSIQSSFAVMKEFDDNIMFRLNWPGSYAGLVPESIGDKEQLLVTTSNKEEYTCILPRVTDGLDGEEDTYNGPSALELLEPLFSQESCTYRLEFYWTYELCHGRFLRQYHEEKQVGKKVHLQEYYLGRFTMEKYRNAVKLENQAEENKKSDNEIKLIPTKKIEGQYLPYLEVNMTDGTTCDLNGKPRMVRVRYMCYPEHKQEIHIVEEVSTCEYEIVVLTQFLCKHPDYKLKEVPLNHIQCHSMNGVSNKPKALTDLEKESLKQNYPSSLGLAEEFDEDDSETLERATREASSPPISPDADNVITVPRDDKLIAEFLTGQYCLYGGSGWWKHEFCYKNKVEQFHKDGDVKTTVVVLGKWNEKKHLEWIEQNSTKRPKKGSSRRHVTHFYSDGDLCDITGRPRSVEVKLKCKSSVDHPSAVSLYLLEPKTCEYILGVESPILCPLIESADSNGLFTDSQESESQP